MNELDFLDDESKELIGVATLNKHRTNKESYRRFLEAAHGCSFHREDSIQGVTKAATNDDVLEWMERQRRKYQDMFYKDATSDISGRKLEVFFDAIRGAWVDGRKKRFESDAMLSVFASIREYYKLTAREPQMSALLGLVKAAEEVTPMFNAKEIAHLMQANKQVLYPFADEYIEAMDFTETVTPSDIWVHRGMNSAGPLAENVYEERRCVVSWSVALSVAEQFSQTGDGDYRVNISIPLPNMWDRALVFTPFVPDVSLKQYELAIVPQWVKLKVEDNGLHAGVHEYELVRR